MSLLDDIPLIRGDSYDWEVVFDEEIDENGMLVTRPVDLSGKTLAFTVKAQKNDPDSLALCQAHVTFPADAMSQAGRGWLFVPHTETEGLPILEGVPKPGENLLYYDFQLSYVDALGRTIVTTLATGTKRPVADATRTVFV